MYIKKTQFILLFGFCTFLFIYSAWNFQAAKSKVVYKCDDWKAASQVLIDASRESCKERGWGNSLKYHNGTLEAMCDY